MKPQDFFITSRDFFAIIVPGAMLLILIGAVSPRFNLWLMLETHGVGAASTTLDLLICFVCTYAIGTMLGGFGSRLDWASDKITEKMMLATGGQEHVRFGLRKMDKLRQTEALAQALELAIAPGMRAIETRRRPWSTRAFWWNYLRLNCPEAMTELDRIEGQQKQFRSMTVGALVMVLVYYLAGEFAYMLIAGVAVLYLACSYWSYRNRFTRRLLEAAIVYSVPEPRFVETGQKFFDAGEGWSVLVRR